MSEHRLEVAELRRNRTWSYGAPSRRQRVRWWPTSLPGSDHEDAEPARPKPARRRVRRGRIQLIRG